MAGEYNSPPAACMPGALPYAIIIPPTLGPFPPGTGAFGGSAVDNDGNPFSGPGNPAFLHTDGFMVDMTITGGGFVLTMPVGGGPILPGPISGLGYDDLGDIVWVTDGALCAGVGLANGVPPPIIVPPFPLPLGGGFASGVDWDPCTGTIWFCEFGSGLVTNCTVGGGVVIFSFAAVGPLAPTLTGLEMNTAVPGIANIQVTDSFMVAEFTPGGLLAAPGPFYLTINPYPIPLWGGPVDGLGFSLRPQRYGVGCSPSGIPPVINFFGGHTWAGNAGFGVNQTGATPGANCFLVYNFFPQCPPVTPPNCPPGTGAWVFPWFGIIPLGAVPATGNVSINLPLPPAAGGPCGPPVGAPVFMQFLNYISTGPIKFEFSDALSFTLGGI
jgi:hypothetical protein